MKVVLVTGASSGIGRSIAAMLALKGCRVYGTSRKIEPGQVTRGIVSMMRLDVTSEESARQAVAHVIECEGRLDALINNAGNGIAGAVEDTSLEEAKAQFDVNFFGALNVSRAAIPELVKTKGIIVNIGSVAGSLPIAFQGMYSASKAALASLSATMRLELAGDGVRVCLVEPGDTRTGFTKSRTFAKGCEDSRYRERMKKSVSRMERDERNGAPPRKVAKVVWSMMRRKNPPVRRSVGYYELLLFAKRLLPVRVVLWVLGKMYG